MGIVSVSRDDIFNFDCLAHLLQPRLLLQVYLLTNAAQSISRLVLKIHHILKTAHVLTHITGNGWCFLVRVGFHPDVLLALQIYLGGRVWLFSSYPIALIVTVLVHDLDPAMADQSMVLWRGLIRLKLACFVPRGRRRRYSAIANLLLLIILDRWAGI